MEVLWRLPTEEEIKAARFNRVIDIIQEVCHTLSVIVFIIGFGILINAVGMIECGIFGSAVFESMKCFLAISASILLYNM